MQPLSWLSMKSHYQHHGKHNDRIEWLVSPYKWDQYSSISEAYDDSGPADVYLFSSYVWNYDICDDFARLARSLNPNAVLLLGGPMIGSNDPELLHQRYQLYDYILQPTQPGEIFLCEFLDVYLGNNRLPDYDDLSWEMRSKKTCTQIMPEYSVYEENKVLLEEMKEYADAKDFRFNISFETTRGCPFKCTFCEWGGGTGSTKIIKKNLEVVEKDLGALKHLGLRVVELCDANFGAFRERDIKIYQMAWDLGVILNSISMVKLTDLERKKQLIDKWIDIATSSDTFKHDREARTWDIIPAMAIQSTSVAAMKATNRVDLTSEEKIQLSRHINDRRQKIDLPVVFPDFILGMPGSTVDDFYQDFEIFWNQGAFSSSRYIYMFLPDTENTEPAYLINHGIKLVKVYSDFSNGIRSGHNLYQNRQAVYYTLSECHSLNPTDMCEIWIMNFLGNFILERVYPNYLDRIPVADFMKLSWRAVQQLPFFASVWQNAVDLFDPSTPPRNSERMLGQEMDPFGLDMMQNHGAKIENYLGILVRTWEVNK